MQEDAAGAEKKPALHVTGTMLPATHAAPAGHTVHSGKPLPLVTARAVLLALLYEPARHGVGAVTPAPQKLPGGQAIHSAAAVRFVAAENVPAGQGSASGELAPAGQ